MASKRALERAQALIGTPFRPQGRDPAQGVDCIGLAMMAFRIERAAVPNDYRISSSGRTGEFLGTVNRLFRKVGRARPGNLVLMRVGEGRLHLGVVSDAGIIHADARRGRVIEGPIPLGAQVIGVFRQRRRATIKGKI